MKGWAQHESNSLTLYLFKYVCFKHHTTITSITLVKAKNDSFVAVAAGVLLLLLLLVPCYPTCGCT